LPPTISIEKWVQNEACDSGWQKEISAKKGDWIRVKVTVNVTGTMDPVWVRVPALAGDPWARIQNLEVDGVSVSGDIAEGISLGELTDESREITFRIELSKATYRYPSCGENILESVAETGDCSFEDAESDVVQITVDVYCAPRSRDSKDKEEDEDEGPTVITR
jgi:hypothetical protein